MDTQDRSRLGKIHRLLNVLSEHKVVCVCLAELTEFVLQLDEEVEAMQATILHMEQQQKPQQQHKHSKNTTSRDNSNSSSSKSGKDRTKGTSNGPVEPASTSTSTGT